MEQKIVMLPVEQLYPHPDNPRKDVGDVTELAESIRAMGVMQNLTVVPGHRPTDEEWNDLNDRYAEDPDEALREKLNSKYWDEGYTVVIGHRRLAAAKLAGAERRIAGRIRYDVREIRRVARRIAKKAK